jgi:hypothetical protein
MPPDLSHRAEMLLEFWFAPEGPSERDQLRDIWFQATPVLPPVRIRTNMAAHNHTCPVVSAG